MGDRALTPTERAHLWLLATSATGHPVAPVVGDVHAIPVSFSMAWASLPHLRRGPAIVGTVEVLLDNGVVLLEYAWLSEPGTIHTRTGAYARGRVRRADHGSRWSARGWWAPVADADARDGLIYDWAHLASAKVGQCWGDGEWKQAPPDGALIFQWQTAGRPGAFYEVT